ncbi:MAG: hypothetical protein U0354_08805 [Candidatus Sericytochromatia bacterium]
MKKFSKTIIISILISLNSCFNSVQVNKTDNTKTTKKENTPTNKNIVLKPQISEQRTVTEGLRKADIMIVFKDNEKIRFNFNENKFYSLKNTDVSKLNSIIKEYKIRMIEPHDTAIGKSEEELETQEKNNEKTTGGEYPNAGSIYYISTEEINVKEFIEKLRKENCVLSINERDG